MPANEDGFLTLRLSSAPGCAATNKLAFLQASYRRALFAADLFRLLLVAASGGMVYLGRNKHVLSENLSQIAVLAIGQYPVCNHTYRGGAAAQDHRASF
jgi:hypothetical protein